MTFLCTCPHCRARIAFDPKRVGETTACPACNLDVKLYKQSQVPDSEPAKPIAVDCVVHKLNETGHTECCGVRLFELPECDRGTYEDPLVTCKGEKRSKQRQGTTVEPTPAAIPAPPVIADIKRKYNLIAGLLLAASFAVFAVVLAYAVCFLQVKAQRYSPRDSLQSMTGQEYGLRDHMTTGIKCSDADATRFAYRIGMDRAGAAEFVKGYNIGWNLVGNTVPPEQRRHVNENKNPHYDALRRGQFRSR